MTHLECDRCLKSILIAHVPTAGLADQETLALVMEHILSKVKPIVEQLMLSALNRENLIDSQLWIEWQPACDGLLSNTFFV